MDIEWLKSFHRIFLVSTRWRVLAMLFILISYLLFGSIVLGLLDRKYLSENLLKSRMSTHELIKSMVEVLRKKFSFEEIGDSFSKEHFDTFHDEKEIVTKWYEAYEKCILLAMLLIGTIGYGNAEPTQGWGVLLLLIYLIIGYPIQFIMIRLLGLQIRSFFRRVLNKVKDFKYRYLPESCHHQNIDLYLTIFLFFLAMGVIFVFGPAAIFERFEDWSYTEGLYFSVMTLCAIGFGDYAAGVSSRATDAYLYSLYSVAIFFWIVLGIAYFDTYLELGSYTAGVFILDKLDGKRSKRKAAREDASNLYNLVADLNWKLAKYCPREFTKHRVYQIFLDIYVNNPEQITAELMQELHETSQELKAIAGDKLLQLHLSEVKSLFEEDDGESRSESAIALELKSYTERRRSARMTLSPSGKLHHLPPSILTADKRSNLSEIESASSSPSDRSRIETLLEKRAVSNEVSSAEVEEENGQDRREKTLDVDSNASKELSDIECASTSSSDRSTVETSEKEGEVLKRSEAEVKRGEDRKENMQVADRNTSKELAEFESSSHYDKGTIESLSEKEEVSMKTSIAEAEEEYEEERKEKMMTVDSNKSKELPGIEYASSSSSDPSSVEDGEGKGKVLKKSPSAEVEEKQKKNQSNDNKECD